MKLSESGLLAEDEDLKRAIIPRNRKGSKAENGSVAIIGGCSLYHGAPILASLAVQQSLASLRIGTGYVVLHVPRAIADAARAPSPNVIVKPFGKNNIGSGKFEEVRESIDKADAVVIGPGMGRKPHTLGMAARIIKYAVDTKKKVVVDADAIYSVKILHRIGSNAIATPQEHEFSELLGKFPDRKNIGRRIEQAKEVALGLNSCILLKGHETIITDGKKTKIVVSSSSALATMGTGDVLSGMIGGYAAAGADVFNAGVAAALLHSRIGDALHMKKGNHIIASDVVEMIPEMAKAYDIEK